MQEARTAAREDAGPARPRWSLAATDDGSPTFVHAGHGEACHSRSGAWLEARERYALPCRIAERAAGGACVRVLDVGTGLGWNIAAALAAAEGASELGRIDVVTLERDPEILAATLALAPREDGGESERWHASVRRTLGFALEAERTLPAAGLPLGRASRLRLILGDARASLPALPAGWRFDACFLDPFSPAVEPELWGAEFLAAVAARLAPHAWLSTYTASLAVRARLRAAGLRVGPGPAVGRKSQGTLASPDLDPGSLDARTERKLARRLGGAP